MSKPLTQSISKSGSQSHELFNRIKMKFEALTHLILQAGKLIGIRLKYSDGWHKYLEIFWMGFIFWNLISISIVGSHFILNHLNDYERALFWFGQVANSYNATIRISIFLYQRAHTRNLIDELSSLTKKGKIGQNLVSEFLLNWKLFEARAVDAETVTKSEKFNVTFMKCYPVFVICTILAMIFKSISTILKSKRKFLSTFS